MVGILHCVPLILCTVLVEMCAMQEVIGCHAVVMKTAVEVSYLIGSQEKQTKWVWLAFFYLFHLDVYKLEEIIK